MALFSKLELALGSAVGLDFLAPGTTRKIAMKALTVAARGIAPVTVPAAAALGPIAPIAIGAGLGYAALQTDPGQQLLEAAAERGRQDRLRFQSFIESERAQEMLLRGRERGVIAPPSFLVPSPIRKRVPSAFNKAVSAGMKTVKKSTSYGAKGIITAPTKVFSMVTKLASAKKKKKKAPKKGIRRKIWGAMGRYL